VARKKHSNTGNQIIQSKDGFLPSKTDRQKKIMNTIVNASIILMSTMMGEFTKAIMNTTGAMASGIAGELGGKKDGEKVNKEFKQILPEADEKIKAMISDVRKEVYVQLEQKSKDIEPLLSDPAFDIGPKLIEKYDFKLPKLTEELDDSALAQYAQLVVNEDPRFAKMFKELISWINTLPKFPEKTNAK
jgi:hypothetical protein